MTSSNNRFSVVLVDSTPSNPASLRNALDALTSSVQLDVVTKRQMAGCSLPVPANTLGSARRLILICMEPHQAADWTLLSNLAASKEHRPSPIIVLSDTAEPDNILKAYQLGAASFLTKPQSEQEWQTLVNSLASYWFETVTLP